MPAVPIVYIGPTIARPDAEATLPGADFRPPIARGDLYAARERGASLFVIIDGVFFQQQAVSPREIRDVLEDGAVIVGASSMGALRAAECWPLGMLGMGAIYRLFRRGVLGSDDELAVLIADEEERRALSVALVNVRYALAKVVRGGRLEQARAERILQAAVGLFYTDRHWRVILERAGIHDPDGQLKTLLSGYDLKRDDAQRALRSVARRLAAEPGWAERPRRGQAPFTPSAGHRERPYDALGGASPWEVRGELARWHLLSGRYLHHLLPIAVARHGEELRTRLARAEPRAALLLSAMRDRRMLQEPSPALAGPAALRITQVELWRAFIAREADFAEALWAELVISGELDAELFRWRALQEAAAASRELALEPRPRDRYLAERAMLAAHGFGAWVDLQQAAEKTAYAWADFVEHREQLAHALRMRERLFNLRPRSTP